MVFAETNKQGCIVTNHQDRCKFGVNKCQNRSTNFTERRSAPKGLHVYLSAYEKIKIIVKTKITETDSGVGISIKEGVLCPYN